MSSVGPAAERSPVAKQRDPAIDFVKGALVIAMLVYHAMSILSTAGAEQIVYVRFVSGSFVLVTGYILGRFAATEREPRGATYPIALRGLKLIALFVALNFLIVATGFGNPKKSIVQPVASWAWIVDVFVIGMPGRASFQILLPIACVLVLAPILLRLRASAAPLLAASLLLAAAADSLWSNSINADFITLGIVGIAVGMLTQADHAPIVPGGLWGGISLLAAAVFAMSYLVANLATYAIGTVAILLILYDIGRKLGAANMLSRAITLLGQASLMNYIVQIVILQVILRLIGGTLPVDSIELLIAIIATAAALVALSTTVKYLAQRSPLVAGAYKMVFS